jgi:hypothetical protein
MEWSDATDSEVDAAYRAFSASDRRGDWFDGGQLEPQDPNDYACDCQWSADLEVIPKADDDPSAARKPTDREPDLAPAAQTFSDSDCSERSPGGRSSQHRDFFEISQRNSDLVRKQCEDT